MFFPFGVECFARKRLKRVGEQVAKFIQKFQSFALIIIIDSTSDESIFCLMFTDDEDSLSNAANKVSVAIK